jgi:hypothetical protein
MYNTLFTYRLLAYLSSAKKPLDGADYSLENCTAPENQSVYDYIFMSGTEPPPGFNGTMEDCRKTPGCGYCYNITAKLIKAVSPGKIFPFPFSQWLLLGFCVQRVVEKNLNSTNE